MKQEAEKREHSFGITYEPIYSKGKNSHYMLGNIVLSR